MASANGGKNLVQTLDDLAAKDKALVVAENKKAAVADDIPAGYVRVRLVRPLTDGAGKTWEGVVDLPAGKVPKSAEVLGTSSKKAEEPELDLDA